MLVVLVITNVAYAQELVPAGIVWKTGESEVSIADAQKDGIHPEESVADGENATTRGGKTQDFSIECVFPADSLKKVYPNGVDYEVRWYYYMSTRRMLMSSYTVKIDHKDANEEGFVVLVCKPKQNLKSGWWEVSLKNKVTNKILQYGGEEAYKVLIK